MITNEERAGYGLQAIEVGTPDRGANDDRTDAVDTLANIFHFVGSHGFGVEDVIDAARMHYEAECDEERYESE